MKTLKITSRDVEDTNYSWKKYIGKTDVSDYDGNIEIDENLGCVRFSGDVKASGYILAKEGSGIKARLGIEAGLGIKVGLGIETGWGIKAGLGIETGYGIKAGYGIKTKSGIKAGWGIEARDGIVAEDGIVAGWGIKAGLGIRAGYGISCKLELDIGLRIFAGLCLWRKPTEDEMKIICGKLISGEVCYGKLIETRGHKEKVKEVVIDGVTYIPQN